MSSTARAADPTTADCLTAAESSVKAGNQHHLREERTELLVCAATSCPADVRKECIRKVDEVNAAIPTIIFDAEDSSGNDLGAVKVVVDGQPLVERLEGMALSVDPGEHRFVFETAGQPPFAKVFVIREAEKERRERIRFGEPAAPPLVPAASPAQPAVVSVPSPPLDRGEVPGHGLGVQQTLAIVSGAVGVISLGIGTGFALATISKKNDARAACPATCQNASGAQLWTDAVSSGNVATALFIVAAAGLGGAVVLWLTAPSPHPTLQVGIGPGSMRLAGSW